MTHGTGMTRREKTTGARYVVEVGIGVALFLVAFLLLPDWWTTQPGSWQHLVLALLPLIPIVWIVLAVWRHLRRIDELQRAALVRSLAFGFAVSMVTALLSALLRAAGINVASGEWIVFIAGMLGWGLAVPVCLARAGL